MGGYIGVNGTAKKIAGIYVGVNGVAKKVIRSYVGVNGVAKLWYAPDGAPRYRGDIGYDIATAATGIRGGSVGNSYAIFTGGYEGDTFKNSTTAVNTSLVTTYPTGLTAAKAYCLVASTPLYFFVAGGKTGSGVSSQESKTVEVYDSSITKQQIDDLTITRSWCGGTYVNGYTIFHGGGTDTSSTASHPVDVYDQSLTHTVLPNVVYQYKDRISGSSVGNYAVFPGGRTYSSSYRVSAVVDVFDSSLTYSRGTDLTTARMDFTPASNSTYAMFADGSPYTSSLPANNLVTFDASLTKTEITNAFSLSQNWLCATTLNDYSIFSCGNNNSSTAITEAYDSTLTYSLLDPLDVWIYYGAGATVGDYALFTGGKGTASNVNIYAYTK